MISRNKTLLACLAIYFCLSITNGQNATGKDICGTCFCDSLDPYLISCNDDKITELFSDEDWKATIEALEEKNITGNIDFRITGSSITRVTKFPPLNITLLDLAGNNISEIDENAFSELENLDWLDLSLNNLNSTALNEKSFSGKYSNASYFPISVRHLNLSHNIIHIIQKDFFDHLPELITLDLSHNPLKILNGPTSAAISNLPKLEALIMRHSKISDIPTGMLHSLIHLHVLDISSNLFTYVPEEISNSHNLTILDISSNKFEELNNTSFLGLDHVEELSINFMSSLKFIGSSTFGHLRKLAKIEITHNKYLHEISNDAFFGLVNQSKQEWPVKEMLLNDNGLTHIDQSLAAWEYVDHVDIQNNPFRCDCRLRWMAEVLVDKIRRENPMLTNNIICAEPEALRGRSVISMTLEPTTFIRCNSGETDINGKSHGAYDKDPYQTAGVTILVIGIMLIVIGLSILGVIVVKRRAIALALMNHQQIRYERTGTDEIEYSNRYSYADTK